MVGSCQHVVVSCQHAGLQGQGVVVVVRLTQVTPRLTHQMGARHSSVQQLGGLESREVRLAQ